MSLNQKSHQEDHNEQFDVQNTMDILNLVTCPGADPGGVLWVLKHPPSCQVNIQASIDIASSSTPLLAKKPRSDIHLAIKSD